jgi:hypothetical protein
VPFKSQSQRRFFYAAAGRDDIPRKTVRRWENETPKGRKLPEKVMNKSAAFDAGVLAALEKQALSLPFSSSAALARKGAEMGLKGAKPMGLIGSGTRKLKQRAAGALSGARSSIGARPAGMGLSYAT